MLTFLQWVAQLNLLRETYYSFNPSEYNKLFDTELEKTIQRTQDPAHRQILERMRGFNWVGYIARSVRNAGCRDQREVQERTHESRRSCSSARSSVASTSATSGPMDLRFKRSVSNAIRNMTELERNRRRLLPTVSIGREFEPGGVSDLPARSLPTQRREDHPRLPPTRPQAAGRGRRCRTRLRLGGGETKSLVGLASLGSPGRWIVKRAVQEVKQLAREYALSLGDSELLRRVEKAMASEEETVAKRRTTTAARQTVGV